MSNSQHNYPTDFLLAPGETDVYGETLMHSLTAPYLKAQLMCSSTRFVYKSPNTLLGFIPVGTDENTYPLKNIAGVTTSQSFKVGRLVVAAVLVLVGLSMFGSSALGGIIALLLGALFGVTAFPIELRVQNPAGGVIAIPVSMIESAKLKKFASELQNRIFADQAAIQHNEANNMRAQQILLQQMGLQQQMSNQQVMQKMMGQGEQNPPVEGGQYRPELDGQGQQN